MIKSKHYGIMVLILFITGSPMFVIGFSVLTAQAQSPGSITLNVLLLTNESSSSIEKSLRIDKSLNIIKSDTLIDSLSNFDSIFIVDKPLNSSEVQSLLAYLNAGGGVCIFMGPQMTANPYGFTNFSITSSSTLGSSLNSTLFSAISDPNNPLAQIDWASVPETHATTIFTNIAADVNVILRNDTISGSGVPLLFEKTLGNGKIVVYAPWTTLNSQTGEPYNVEITLWPYFNYFIYSTAMYSAGKSFLTYPDWPYSPVPHYEQQVLIGIFVFILTIFAVGAFIKVRNYSKAHKPRIETLSEEILEEVEKKQKQDKWEQIGLHRQVGGFLYMFFVVMLIVIPNAIMQSMILPRFILPYPQAAGWYSFSINLFQAIWVVFDLGTSVALVKYFAEYRVDKPLEAIKYVQIFIWFQMLTGVVQVFLISFLGSIFFPHTFLAHLTWIFIAHSLVQYPGFTLVFMFVFRALQRIDLQQLSNLMYYAVFSIIGPYTGILIFRWWGAQNPIFGEALGGAIGYALGGYFQEWMMFLFTLYLFKKLGFHASTFFRVDFSTTQIKQALKFGAKWTAGQVWVPAVWMLQMIIVSTQLLSWSAQQGYFSLAWNLVLIVSVAALFMDSLMGGISEAYSHKKHKLVELYAAEGLKWGSYIVFWIVSSLYAVGWRFVSGAAGAEWEPANVLLPGLLLFQLIGYFSWCSDNIYAGVGRTGLAALVWIEEQTIRAILMIYFVVYYSAGMLGIIYAYIIALAIKDVSTWAIIRKKITAPKFYVWQTYIGPGLAAIMNFALLEIIAQIIWDNGILSSVLLFFIGTFVSIYWYSFFTGLTGSWDKNTLNEFKRSVDMTGKMRALSYPLYKLAQIGSKSPLFNRCVIDIYDEAMLEARELTEEKKALVI